MGTTANDNIVMQGVEVMSSNGDINIEADRSILFDVALESSYDRATKTEVKRSWYGKKKVYISTITGDIATPASVDIKGNNINILSKFKHPTRPETSIDMYSSRLTANGGKISVRSGGISTC